MSKVPGTFKNSNGNSDSNIPADIKWSETDRPVVFACSQDVTHAPYCDESCDSWMPGESEVLLMNEARAWARIGMSFHGVPTCIAGQVNGIQVNIFDERIRLATMQEFLIEAGICTLDELDEKFRANKLEAMQEMRANNEDAVKAAFIKQKIATPDKRLLGPHGEIL